MWTTHPPEDTPHRYRMHPYREWSAMSPGWRDLHGAPARPSSTCLLPPTTRPHTATHPPCEIRHLTILLIHRICKIRIMIGLRSHEAQSQSFVRSAHRPSPYIAFPSKDNKSDSPTRRPMVSRRPGGPLSHTPPCKNHPVCMRRILQGGGGANAHVPPVQSASRPRQAPLGPQQPDRLVNYARPSL